MRRRLVPDGITERFVTTQGHRMRYLSGGSGPAVVLISGLLGFSFSWSENLGALSKHFTVFAPDLLNTGYSERAHLPADLRSSAMEVLEFMDAVGIQRAHVVGSSYGGTIMMALAAIAPERVETVIAVAPAHCGSENGRWQVTLFSRGIGLWLSRVVRFAPPLLHGYFIKRMYGDPSRALPGTVEEYARAIAIPGTTIAAAKVLRSWATSFEQLCQMMPDIAKTRVRLIWGDKDLVVPLQSAKELMRELPSAELVVIPSAGHLPYEESPAHFNRVVLDILLARKSSTEVASAPRPA